MQKFLFLSISSILQNNMTNVQMSAPVHHMLFHVKIYDSMKIKNALIFRSLGHQRRDTILKECKIYEYISKLNQELCNIHIVNSILVYLQN